MVKKFIETFDLHRRLISVIDQTMVAGVNLLFVALVGRLYAELQFGGLMVALSILNLLLGIHSAFVTVPMNIFASRQLNNELKTYFVNAGTTQFVIAIIFVLLALPIPFAISNSTLSTSLTLVVVWNVSYQMHDFMRRYYMTRMNFVGLFHFDLITSSLKLMSVGIASVMFRNSMTILIALVALVHGICIVVAIFWSLKKLQSDGGWSAQMPRVKPVLRQHWGITRYMIVEIIFYNATTQIYIIASAAFLSPAEVAAFGGFQTISNVINIYLVGLTNYGASDINRMRHDGNYQGWKIGVAVIGILTSVLTIVISGLFLTIPREIVSLVFGGGSYMLEFHGVIKYFAFMIIFRTFNVVIIMALRSVEGQSLIANSTVLSGLLSVAGVYPLVKLFGVDGAALGLLLSQMLLTIFLAMSFVKRSQTFRSLFG